jgi:hypothetical protein
VTAEKPAGDTAKRRRGGGRPFQPGQSGNPSGRPKGSRAEAFAILDNMAAEAAERVLQALVAKAEEGDARAADLVLRRSWPERKGRPVQFAMPTLCSAASLTEAMSAVAAAMAAGEISPDEAVAVAGVLEIQRKVIALEDHEERLKAIEDGLRRE